MTVLRKLSEYLELSMVAYAKWDYENSMNILRSGKRKWILILLAALLPILIYMVADWMLLI